MIINENKSNAVVIGDTQRNKVSIDINNINFITTLLSSNLYSNPQKSFLREIVSNAWDSHVEAHKEDTPVLLIIGDSSIAIRDFGVGLSPERFNDIFLNIGSSTKRENNTQIGGFGIGRFSALACSNMVFITSYYDNIKYQYLMVKDGNSVNIDLINTSPTDEENGLEVRIDNVNVYHYTRYLKTLAFFPNLYVKGNGESEYNDIKIKHYNKFSVANYCDGNILIGNVLYPLDFTIFSGNLRDIVETFVQPGIIIPKFEIGELEITPNRENILYSENTKTLIITRVNDALEELFDIIANDLPKNFDNLGECLEFYFKNDYLLNLGVERSYSLNMLTIINCLSLYNKNLPTFRGKNIYANLDFYDRLYREIRYREMPFTMSVYDNATGNTYNKNFPYRCGEVKRLTSNSVVVIPKDVRVYYLVKNFLREKLGKKSYVIVKESTKEEFVRILHNNKIYDSKELEKQAENLYEEYYDKIYKIAYKFDPNSKEFLDYKSANKKEKTDTKIIEDFSIKIYGKDYYGKESFYNNVDDVKKLMKELGGVIVTNKRDHRLEVLIYLVHNKLNVHIIAVNMNLVSKFVDMPNYINPDDVLSTKSSFIRDMITIKNLKGPYYSSVERYDCYIRKEDKENLREYEYLRREFDCYKIHDFIVTAFKDDTTIYNKEIERWHNLNTYYHDTLVEYIEKMQEQCYSMSHFLVTYFIVKSKCIHVNYVAYKNMIENPIIKSIRK